MCQECPQDIEGAKALLAEAGYGDGDGLEVTLYTSTNGPPWAPLAEVYQQQADAAGITVKLEVVPADSYWSEVWMKEPFYTTVWVERTADQFLNENWRSTARWNESHFQRAEFDALLDAARGTLDFAARRDAYYAAQQLIFDEGGRIHPAFDPRGSAIVGKEPNKNRLDPTRKIVKQQIETISNSWQ